MKILILFVSDNALVSALLALPIREHFAYFSKKITNVHKYFSTFTQLVYLHNRYESSSEINVVPIKV